MRNKATRRQPDDWNKRIPDNWYRGALPAIWQGKPINKTFRIREYGQQVDAHIAEHQQCRKCGCLLDYRLAQCTRCDSRKLVPLFIVNTCSYTYNCTVNRWGCSIHYRGNRPHPFVCTCDECY